MAAAPVRRPLAAVEDRRAARARFLHEHLRHGGWRRGGTPVRIASRRETDPGRTRAQRFVERRAFAAAHAVVVNAEAIKRDLTRHGVEAAKIHTIFNGVDVSRLQTAPVAARAATLATLGVAAPPDHLFVTILANLRRPR